MTNSKGNTLSPAAIQAFLKGPSSRPPPGVTPNLVNPPNRNKEALAIAIICILLATSATLSRLYSRIFVVKRFRIEDYLGIGAFLPFIGVAWSFFYFRENEGFFVHQWDLPGSVLIDLGMNSFVIGIVYSLVMLFLKTAILLEWNRLFVLNHTHNAFFWCSTILIVVNAGIYISAIISDIVACIPVDKVWHFWLEGKCIDRRSRDIVNAAFNLATDIFILILPQRIIWSLQLSPRRKVGVSIMFSVGLLVVVLAAGRLYATITLDYPDDLTVPYDTSYKFSETLIWAFCEVACIFLVFAAPALPKLLPENVVARIASSLRSWSRLVPPGSSEEKKDKTWPPTIGSIRAKPRNHQRIADEELLETHGTMNELTSMSNREAQTSFGGNEKNADSRIVKTVEIDSNGDSASKSSVTSTIDRQYPWLGRLE